MAALPSPTQVAGNHSTIYEAYYNVVDPKGFGSVGGMEAARFLKRSGLSDVILSRIWDLSDPGGRGSLDKAGMFVALKLVALVQNGNDLSLKNLVDDVPPPKMGDIPIPKTKPPPLSSTPLITSLPPSAADWTVKPSEREKYDKLFDSLQPLNGVIPGNKVKTVLMESKLPLDTLGKIWDLADQDKDGMLNRHEFVVAMHLVYKALEKYAIPNTLPPELTAPLKPKEPPQIIPMKRPLDGMKPEVPQPPVVPAAFPIKPVQSVQPSLSWVVSAEEKSKSDALFLKSDVDKDGFVSGGEIRDVFLKSGVPQMVLAQIWQLCDIKSIGKLNNEQFALAMWMIARKLKGFEPPDELSPEMVPPSFRTVKPVDGLVENNNTRYSNPELEMISKDIQELARERLAFETDNAQKEADFKIKTGEFKNLQSEYDTLAATLKQLENQKGEAQKRLNDLQLQVDKLRTQATEQSELVNTQENELKSKKELLDGLKQEQQRLENEKNERLKKLQSLTDNLQETQLNISQFKAFTTQLEEDKHQLGDALSVFESALETNNVAVVSDGLLRISPNFKSGDYFKLGLTNGSSDPFSQRNGNSGFDEDPFQNGPFNDKSGEDPFSAAFSKPSTGQAADPFGSSFNSMPADPFSNFNNTANQVSPAPEPEKDPFGCDPFAVLHAPTRDSVSPGGAMAPPRPSSPSPALPPKKSKQPPPRPAPPRPNQPPVKKQDSFGSEPFQGNAFGSGGGFADFTNFESKLSSTKPPQPTQTKLEFSDDPFKDYRYEDPFNITFDDDEDAVPKSNGSQSKIDAVESSVDTFDPFGLENRKSVPPPFSKGFESNSASGRASAPTVSEDRQLEWASKESLKAERQRRVLKEQEEADLALALKLSQMELSKR